MTNVYRIIAVSLLAGIAVHRMLLFHTPPEVKRYHANVRSVAEDLPLRIGPWIGQNVRVPVQALTVLRPNVMVSRQYVNVETGLTAGIMLVHCADAHAMAGHFPARCYPAKGWDIQSAQRRDWNINGLAIRSTEYRFSRQAIGSIEGSRSVVVINFLLRPGGKMLSDMDEMNHDIIGAGGQSSGAAQVQVYFDGHVPVEQRDAAFRTLVGGYRPAIDAILANANQ